MHAARPNGRRRLAQSSTIDLTSVSVLTDILTSAASGYGAGVSAAVVSAVAAALAAVNTGISLQAASLGALSFLQALNSLFGYAFVAGAQAVAFLPWKPLETNQSRPRAPEFPPSSFLLMDERAFSCSKLLSEMNRAHPQPLRCRRKRQRWSPEIPPFLPSRPVCSLRIIPFFKKSLFLKIVPNPPQNKTPNPTSNENPDCKSPIYALAGTVRPSKLGSDVIGQPGLPSGHPEFSRRCSCGLVLLLQLSADCKQRRFDLRHGVASAAAVVVFGGQPRMGCRPRYRRRGQPGPHHDEGGVAVYAKTRARSKIFQKLQSRVRSKSSLTTREI